MTDQVDFNTFSWKFGRKILEYLVVKFYEFIETIKKETNSHGGFFTVRIVP